MKIVDVSKFTKSHFQRAASLIAESGLYFALISEQNVMENNTNTVFLFFFCFSKLVKIMYVVEKKLHQLRPTNSREKVQLPQWIFKST